MIKAIKNLWHITKDTFNDNVFRWIMIIELIGLIAVIIIKSI